MIATTNKKKKTFFIELSFKCLNTTSFVASLLVVNVYQPSTTLPFNIRSCFNNVIVYNTKRITNLN